MAAIFPAGNVSGTYVPNFEASGKIVIGYSRNPKDFALNKYVTLVPVSQNTGYYLKLTTENAARILSTTLADHAWPDGNDAPQGIENTESSEYFKFLVERYNYSARMGYMAVKQADWNVLGYHAQMLAQQAMTGRTIVVNTAVELASNYANTADFQTAVSNENANLTPGYASAGTATNPVVKAALNYGGKQINKATYATLKSTDLLCRFSPDLATVIGETQEIHTYLKESPFALAQVRGDVENQNGDWNLPTMLYKYKIVIEDAVSLSTTKGYPASPQALSYIADSNKIAMLARPGALVGVEGAPSFSTVHVWVLKDYEMKVESKDDADNQRHLIRVIDAFGVDVVSSISGYLFTKVLHS